MTAEGSRATALWPNRPVVALRTLLTRISRRFRSPHPPSPPTERELVAGRIDAIAEQGRTLGYMLQSSISHIDLQLNPKYRVPPLKQPRTMPAASLRVKRARHYRPGPVTGRKGIPPALALTLLTPLFFIAGGFGVLSVYDHYVKDIVPPETISINAPSRGARVFDRNGTLLYEFLDENNGQRIPIHLEDVSDAFLAATIATEDASFFSNPGVNPRGLLRAAWENFSPLADDPEGSGGSSITQQLVKNVYIAPEERAKRSMERKLREAAYAIDLTKEYSKRQILEWYINEISYGGLYYGVEAAAQGYFGKSARDLTLAEAALLAGIPQSPATYDPLDQPEAAAGRRSEVLELLAKQGHIQVDEGRFYDPVAEEIEAAHEAPIEAQRRTFPIEAPHFILNHIAPQLAAIVGKEGLYRGGLTVTTTLDLALQNETLGILESAIRDNEAASNSRNGAVLIIDNRSGEILSLIGSRDYYRDDIQGNVDNLTALNSPGSTFKPFVYLASFMRLGWTPTTTIEDTPITYRESDGTVFQPQNPTKNSYMGTIPIRTALGNSLNVPAFKTALRLGVPAIVDVAKLAGFTTLHGFYGPAIATGGVDLTAMDLTYGYSVLANNGAMVGTESLIAHDSSERTVDPVLILRIEDSYGNVVYDANDHRVRRQVVPAEQAYMVTSILMDPTNQCATFGCGGVSIPGRVAAVKTGTSEPFAPNGPDGGKIGETWAFGYTPDYTIGVWAGNSNNAPIANIFSTTIAFRVLRDSLQNAYKGEPSLAFSRPSGVPDRALGTSGTQPPQQAAAPSPTPGATSGQARASVTAPSGGSNGVVTVQGWAVSPALQSYRLEVGAGAAPTSWNTLGQWTTPVQGGTLGQWSAGSLPEGVYSLRVVIQDAQAGTIISPAVSVTLRR